MKTKLFVCLAVSFFLSTAINSVTAQSTIQNHKQVAYTITIPGELMEDGFYKPARIIDIEQLSTDDYLPNSIYIKLKPQAKYKLKPGNNIQNDPLIIKLNDLLTTSISCINTELSLSEKDDKHGIGRIYEITYTADKDPYEVCKELINNPDVEYAVPVFRRYSTAFTPNDPQIGSQWAITKIVAKDAWDITKGDTSVVIAIIDGGTDWQHNDLSANIWNNPREIPNNGIDDDTSGKIDDIHGWDFVGNATTTDIQSGNWKEDNNPKNPSASHGTQTAGCASAVTNNNTGIASIGFNCRLLPVKCGSDVSSVTGIFRGYTAILYAASMGADIISCSWGGPGYNPAEEDILQQVTDMGILIVTASGNNGENTDVSPFYPGAYPQVLNVGSTNSSDDFASSSNYGSKVTVFAPGDNILSTTINNGYNSSSGTSLACPIVSGLAGLVKSIHPDWSPYQIRQQIRVNCDNVLPPGEEPFRYLYWGRINAFKTLLYNNGTPEKSIPGMNAYNFALSGDDALKNYNSTGIRVYLTNYLAGIDSVLVNIEPVSSFVSVTKNSFWIYNLNTGDTSHIDFEIQLLSNTPWFKGNAELLVTFTSGNYTDVQKLEIPITLPTTNTFSVKGAVNSSIYPQIHGLSSPDYNSCWGVGESSLLGAIFLKNNVLGFGAYRVVSGASYITDPIYCIHAFDDYIAVAGTGKGYMLRTTNGGANWSSISVSTITSFVNAILFRDQDYGMMLGDPRLNRWGIGFSTDKGQTWTLADNVPAPLTNESGYVGSVSQDGDAIWFGTSQGRIYYSPDFGKSWKVSSLHSGGMVTKMAFIDSMQGIASYTEANGTGQTLFLANTKDGGATWNKKIMNLTNEGLYPVSFVRMPKTKNILAVFTNGYVMTTKDLGLTWEPVLSQQSVMYEASKVFFQQNKVRVWEAGNYLNQLSFDYEFDSGWISVPKYLQSRKNYSIYPVPASDNLNISFKEKSEGSVQIILLDLTGKVIYKEENINTQNTPHTISVKHILPGMYYIRITEKNNSETVPIMIIK